MNWPQNNENNNQKQLPLQQNNNKLVAKFTVGQENLKTESKAETRTSEPWLRIYLAGKTAKTGWISNPIPLVNHSLVHLVIPKTIHIHFANYLCARMDLDGIKLTASGLCLRSWVKTPRLEINQCEPTINWFNNSRYCWPALLLVCF